MGKVWLITGASSGFGRAIAEAARAAGDTVVAAVRRPSTVDGMDAVAFDVTDTVRAAEVVDGVVSRYGRIDVLVNNAGRGLIGAVEETSEAEYRDLMDLLFFGPLALTRAVLPHMRGRGSGAVVQLSSMGGRTSFPGVSAYSAAKFALEGLSEALAAEVAGFGIRVLIVEPGAFRTAFAGGDALLQTASLPAYEDVVGPFRRMMPTTDGRQPGDPAKAAAAILAALEADEPPLRLALGNDAADVIARYLDDCRDEFLAWEPVTRGTDF
jgi:NAD(P)-dependent dehydrogenase (short-subunit alcohol dehydrogenase family)